MSTSSPSIQWDTNYTTRLWQAVSECVDAFTEAWESSGEPPDLIQFAEQADTDLRRLTLIELIKIDLEYRFTKEHPTKSVEVYLAEFPEISRDGLPLDLVYEEYHLRRRRGDPVNIDDYVERFSEAGAEVRRLLGFEAPNVTTTLFSGESIAEVKVSDRLDDFDLLAQLGKGAFATVFLARQLSMQRLVALKVSGDRGLEAQTLAQLDHPHIVRVYDQRYLPDRGLRLLYMQYVAGGTLQGVVDAVRTTIPGERNGKMLLKVVDRALDERGESPPTDSTVRQRLSRSSWGETICWIGARLAAALDYAHRHGVLHRDVKPANVLLASDGTPKLVDFNISCCTKVEGATPAAYFGGSLAYMSPEQLEACNPSHERQPDELDARSEVYSLGVLLWELIVGQRPFADAAIRTSWPQLLTQMVAQRRGGIDSQALAQLPRHLPAGLTEVLVQCLQADPEKRYASAGDLARQLELCLRPTAQRLMAPRARSWPQWVREYPTLSLAVSAIIPNAILSVLNVMYNVPTLIEPLPASAQQLFYGVQLAVVNGSLYTVALTAGIMLCWPALGAINRLNRGTSRETITSAQRQVSLRMADSVFAVTLGAWIVSGIVFPVWLRLHLGAHESFHSTIFAHFLISQILCGLVAATIAFFLVAFLTVRALHPVLVKNSKPEERDMEWLGRLDRRMWRYFGVSVAVPFLALAVLIGIDSGNRWVFGAISLMGLFGFLFSFALARRIQSDLGALAMALAPTGEILPGETQGFDLFASSNRM